MTEPLAPGSTIGILGGGQLGRMLSMAAARLGLTCHIYEPAANPPAAQVADRLTTAAYEDTEALKAFADSVDVITYEFENIPTSALDLAEAILAIAPRLRQAAEGDPVWGVYHYSGAGVTHWAGFAEAVFEGALARGMIAAAPEVAHIPSSDYPTPAKRPANSAMDCSKFETVFGLKTKPWRDSLGHVLDLLKED